MKHSLRTPLLAAAVLAVLTWSATALAKGKPGGGGGGGGPPPAPVELVYAKPGSSGWDLWVAAPDGSDEQLLLAGVGDGQMAPAWSPDGSRIAFNGTVNGEGLYLVDADGTNLTKIHAGSARSPDWSPDGTHLAFAAWDGAAPYADGWGVWRIASDGTGLTQVADTQTRWEMVPRWSPDGSRLALTVDDFTGGGTGWDVVVYTLADGSETNLTETAGSPVRDQVLEFTVADWSSDGVWVAFAARELGAKWDVWAVQAAAPANAVNLTASSRTSEQRPSWSPDDTRIVCAVTSNSSKVVVVDLGSGGTTTIDRGGSSWPDWQR